MKGTEFLEGCQLFYELVSRGYLKPFNFVFDMFELSLEEVLGMSGNLQIVVLLEQVSSILHGAFELF